MGVARVTSNGADGQLPPAPHVKTPALGEKDIEQVGREGKRTKCDHRDDKGVRKKNVQPPQTEGKHNAMPTVFFDPTYGPGMGLPVASLTSPFQALIFRHDTEKKHYFTSNKEGRKLNLSQKPEPYTEGSSFTAKSGRGLRNAGNTCFLNATIQCLGAIDEVHEASISTKKSTITQDRLLLCVRELQGTDKAYTPSPLIQQIPNLIRYKKGEPADAHENPIALINDLSEPIKGVLHQSTTLRLFRPQDFKIRPRLVGCRHVR